MNIIETLKELTDIPGISGQEYLVREYIISKIEGKCEYFVDPLGNIIVFKKGENTPKNKIYFSAHMDEVGFIVTDITDDGNLRFATSGGIDSRVILGKHVEIGEKRIPGVIGGTPIHMLKKDELYTPPKVEDMLIDIGAKDKADAEQHVNIGDFVVYYAPMIEMGDNAIVGKALDDRIGCALMIDLINSELPYDVHFGFTTQEEVGCMGGETAAYTVAPDIGIALEATTASDIAGVEKSGYVTTQGEGPAISFKDRGTTYDMELYRLTLEAAKKAGIPAQAKLGVFGGNEARVIQTAKGGSRVVAISLPTRYIHSPSSVVDKRDIASTRQLIDVLIKEYAEV